MKINNLLAIQAAFHQELAMMLEDDSTSKSNFKLSQNVHEKAKIKAATSSVKEALKKAADYHLNRYKKLKDEFEEKYKTSFDEFYACHEDAILDSFKISESNLEEALFSEPQINLNQGESSED